MDKDESEEIAPSEEEVTELDTESEEITLSEEDMGKIKKDYWMITSIDKWRYLSYLLLALTWVSIDEMQYIERTGEDASVGFVFLPLMTVLSFSRSIYLRYNDNDYSGIMFFNQSINIDSQNTFVSGSTYWVISVSFKIDSITEMLWSISALIGCFAIALVIPLSIYFAARAKERREEKVRNVALDKTTDESKAGL